jgi:predicted nucleotidyltransferase
MAENRSPQQMLARKLATHFSEFSTVEAIALGGSQAEGATDAGSDVDLYVYTTSVIPLSTRAELVEDAGASRADLNLQFWDLGDEWVDAETGIEVDVIYWDPAWITGQLDRVWRQHQASLGYTTCFWYTVRHSHCLYDRRNWFRALQEQSRQPYPEALRRAIVAKNHPVLRRVIPSYAHQIEKASQRGNG